MGLILFSGPLLKGSKIYKAQGAVTIQLFDSCKLMGCNIVFHKPSRCLISISAMLELLHYERETVSTDQAYPLCVAEPEVWE